MKAFWILKSLAKLIEIGRKKWISLEFSLPPENRSLIIQCLIWQFKEFTSHRKRFECVNLRLLSVFWIPRKPIIYIAVDIGRFVQCILNNKFVFLRKEIKSILKTMVIIITGRQVSWYFAPWSLPKKATCVAQS